MSSILDPNTPTHHENTNENIIDSTPSDDTAGNESNHGFGKNFDYSFDHGSGKEKFYGRRMGRPLRDATKSLIERALPAYTFDRTLANDPHADFDEDRSELWLEIGCGGGEHLCGQAVANPNVNLIGAEAFVNGISLMLRQLLDTDVPNARIWPDDVRPLLDEFPESSMDKIFLLFPDPWPKARHNKRRFVNNKNLERLKRLLKPGGMLRIATDHSDYRQWICDHLKTFKGLKAQFSWESLPTDQPADWVQTRYETKALNEGIVCTYMDFKCEK